MNLPELFNLGFDKILSRVVFSIKKDWTVIHGGVKLLKNPSRGYLWFY